MRVAVNGLYLRLQFDRDIRLPMNLIDQIMRHAVFERRASNEERHPSRMIGEVDCRLACRISSADEMDVETLRGTHFAARCPVVDTLADESVEPLGAEASPRDTCGEDEGPRPHDLAAVEKHFTRRRIDALDRPGHDDFRTQPPGLLQRAARQLIARDATGESEVVLD